MAKRTNKCWLSPNGEIVLCDDHGKKAKEIMSNQYQNEKQSKEDSRDFLQKKGWARFCDISWAITGSGWVIPRHLTTSQKEKIYELTNEWIEN